MNMIRLFFFGFIFFFSQQKLRPIYCIINRPLRILQASTCTLFQQQGKLGVKINNMGK